jgi:hypothetical protein
VNKNQSKPVCQEEKKAKPLSRRPPNQEVGKEKEKVEAYSKSEEAGLADGGVEQLEEVITVAGGDYQSIQIQTKERNESGGN